MFSFTTESGSHFMVRNGRITRTAETPVGNLGQHLTRECMRVVRPIAIGERFVFRLPRFGGEIVRTSPVVGIFYPEVNASPVPKGFGLTVNDQIRELES